MHSAEVQYSSTVAAIAVSAGFADTTITRLPTLLSSFCPISLLVLRQSLIMSGECRFQPAWLGLPEFTDYLEKDHANPSSAKCKFCMKTVSLKNQGVTALRIHARGTKHRKGKLPEEKNLRLETHNAIEGYFIF